MVKYEGNVIDITNTTTVSGGGENSSVTTSHISTFQINNKSVQVILDTPPIINEGDRVLIVGTLKNGILMGYAYKNITKGVQGFNPYKSSLVIGSAFFAASFIIIIMAFTVFNDPFFGVFPKIIGSIMFLGFITISSKVIKFGLQAKKAKILVCS